MRRHGFGQPVIFAGTLIAALASSAAAGTIVVTPDGDKTIQQAVDEALPNDVIELRGGTFFESVMLSSRSNISIVGKRGAKIDAGQIGDGIHLDHQCSDITISKVHIVGASMTGFRVIDSQDVLIEKCNISAIGTFAVLVRGSSRVTLSRAKISGVGSDAVNFGGQEEQEALAPAPCQDCTIERCKISQVGRDGVEYAGTGNLVSRCKIKELGGRGITHDGSDTGTGNIVDRNKISDLGVGIRLAGSSDTASNNRISKTGADAIRGEGTGGHTIEGNKIKSLVGSADGIEVETGSDGCLVKDNKITKPGGDGIECDADGATIDGNKIRKAGNQGVRIQGTGCTIQNNNVKKSGDVDLRDTTGGGSNVYGKNKFGTENLDPE